MLKRLGESAEIRGIAARFVAGYVRFIYRLGHWTMRGEDKPAAFWDRGAPFILAFWHGRLMMIPRVWPRRVAMNILTSHHRDGDLSARAIAHFGLNSIPGSSRRGGSAALRELVRALAAGQCVGIAPDGPRGPVMRATEGIIALARLSGAPIVPVSCDASRRRILNTWDRFLVPLPFASGVFVWGEAMVVPRDADPAACEAAREELEARLNSLTAEADRLCGHASPAPEAAPTARAAAQ